MGERDPSLPDGDEEPKRDSGLAFILGLEDVISSKHRSGGRCESRRQHRLVPRLEGVGGQEHEGERLIQVGRRRQVSREREGGLLPWDGMDGWTDGRMDARSSIQATSDSTNQN